MLWLFSEIKFCKAQHTMKTMKDVKNLLLQYGKITIADIQKVAPTKQFRLSKYSRHAQQISDELSNSFTQNLELMSKFFKLVLERLSTEKDLQELIIQLLLMMYGDQCPADPVDFNIPDCIRFELMTLKPPDKTCLNQLYRGILVPLATQLYFDILSATQDKTRNFKAILMNRVVYGDTMGDSKEIQVREVLTGKQLDDGIEITENYCQLADLGVALIIHYGELSPTLVDFCINFNILALPVTDYETLFQTQQMLNSGSILFDVENDLKEKDIVEVCLQCHTQQLQYQPKVDEARKRVKKDAAICGFVQLQSPQKDLRGFYYTVLLYGRGQDLAVLKREAFFDLLNRIKYLLKVVSFATEPVEDQICRMLSTFREQDIDIDSLIEYTPWVLTDIRLFSNVICKHLLETFQAFRSLCHSSDNEVFEIFEYKEQLWKESLRCVNKILYTRDVKMFSL